MHIIFGTEHIEDIKKDGNHTILELDTIRPRPGTDPVVAYCVVSAIPLTEISQTEAYIVWHQDLIKAYKARDWEECVRCLNALGGKFNGELDSFYTELRERIRLMMKNPPDPDWDGVYEPWKIPEDNIQ
jgi:hypothetical protein